MKNKIYESIAVIFHPIFMPSIAGILFLKEVPITLSSLQKTLIIMILTIGTLIIPLTTLLLFKILGLVKSLKANTIKERKLPVLIMITNYTTLGFILSHAAIIPELSILCYATAVGLIVIYMMFYFKIKASLHLFGIGSLLGLECIFGYRYYFSPLVIGLLFIIIGLVATARLELLAHNKKEILIGGVLGVALPILLFFIYNI